MKNSKLIQLLKTFSKAEIIEFEKYLKSPLSESSKYILNFFLELKKHYPEFSEENVKKEKIYSILYKNKSYNDSSTRSIISKLISNAEHYLSYKRFKKDNLMSDYYLLFELRLRELNDYFDLRSKQMLNNFNSSAKMDLGGFLYEFLVELEITGYKLYKDKNQDSIENIKNLGNSLLIFFAAYSTFVTSYIDHLSTFHSRKVESMLNINFFPNFDYSKFIETLKDDNSDKARFLRINYNLYNLILKKDPHESFKNLRDLWMEAKDFLSDSMRKSIYDFLGNFCIVENRKADSKYVREFFNMSKVMLEDKLFLIDTNIMQFNTFRQIFRNILRLKEFEWAEIFIKEYSKFLTAEDREMLVETAFAELAFEKGEFEVALSHLLKTKQGTRYLKLEIRELYIKVYYELNYQESLYSSIDTFRHYLNRTGSALNENISNAKTFLKYLKKILSLPVQKTDSNIKLLSKELSVENNIHHKEWLVSKLEAFNHPTDSPDLSRLSAG